MSLAFSENNYEAIGKSTGEILLWNKNTDLPFRKLLGHTGAVYSLAFYDDAYLISGSADNTIRIWHIYNGTVIQTINDHSDIVLSVAILQNGFFGSGSNNGVILIHSFFEKPTTQTTKRPTTLFKTTSKPVIKKKAVYTITEVKSPIICLVSLGSDLLASGSVDFLIRIWNLTTKSYIRSLEGHSNNITSMVGLENGNFASGSLDKTILVWSLSSGNILKNISGHESSIISLALLKNGQLAVGLANGKILIRNLDLDTVVSTLIAQTGPVTTLLVIYIKEIEFLASASSKEAKVFVWDVESRSKRIINLKAKVRALSQLKDGRLAIGTEKNAVVIHDLNDQKNPDIELVGHNGAVLALAVLENGDLVSSSSDKKVLMWKKEAGTSQIKQILKFQHHVSALISVNRQDIKFALSDLENNELVFYEIEFVENDEKAEQKQIIKAHSDGVSALALLDNFLVSASWDGTIRIFNKDFTIRKNITSYKFKITSLISLKNGYFAAGYRDGLVIIWNKEGNEIRKLKEHKYLITSMILLENGFLATCSVDGKIIMWNWNDGNIVRTIDGQNGAMTSIVELDNSFLATGSANNTVIIWNSNGEQIR